MARISDSFNTRLRAARSNQPRRGARFALLIAGPMVLLAAMAAAQTTDIRGLDHGTLPKPARAEKVFIIKPDAVMDRSAWASLITSAAMTVLDTEQSAGFQSRGCQELNPIIGPRPSVAKLRATSYGTAGLVFGFTYLLRRHEKHNAKLKMQNAKLPQIMNLPFWTNGAGHAAGFALTIKNHCGWR